MVFRSPKSNVKMLQSYYKVDWGRSHHAESGVLSSILIYNDALVLVLRDNAISYIYNILLDSYYLLAKEVNLFFSKITWIKCLITFFDRP